MEDSPVLKIRSRGGNMIGIPNDGYIVDTGSSDPKAVELLKRETNEVLSNVSSGAINKLVSAGLIRYELIET